MEHINSDARHERSAEHSNASNTALTAAVLILQFHELSADQRQIVHDFAGEDEDLDRHTLVLALRKYGLKSSAKKVKLSRLENQQLPAIAWLNDGTACIVGKVAEGKVLFQVGAQPPAVLSIEEFGALYTGELVLAARRANSVFEDVKFGIGWFLPVMLRYKGLLAEVFTASFFIQAFGLITPLVFQVVIDKVLVHQGLTTLNVLIIALLAMTFFEAVLGYFRTVIFSHTTSRIDVQLGSKLYEHMMALPVGYFESRPTGQTVARVRELENVRDFITGNALTAVLDLIFAFLFFAVMYLFSPTLTWIVAGSIPFYILLSILITPSLRKRIEEKFQRGAQNQAFLVESVSGAETLKAMAVEPQMKRRWDEVLAAYVKASFRTIALGAFGSQSVQFINKTVTALLLFVGAQLVIKGDLTVGQLVAFNMLAGQISQPIIRIAQLWQDFQQFRLSIQKLGDVLNAKPEVIDASVPENLPPVKGGITFDKVTFRYNPEDPEVLRNISLEIKAGEVIGFVGRSGSGKSTITKLVQRLYVPESGQVTIDGINISLLHPAWLRRQIGVVLQENLLFNRTIRENIALAKPSASMEEVVHAAKLAGAEEFILRLPRGFDTLLEERGSNLSGGQRQRIAIARALITDPRILILDEATSALDYESERVIQANMSEIVKDRTVIIVAHRLSAVKGSDRIYVMDSGQIVETGKHQDLVVGGGVYASLFAGTGG